MIEVMLNNGGFIETSAEFSSRPTTIIAEDGTRKTKRVCGLIIRPSDIISKRIPVTVVDENGIKFISMKKMLIFNADNTVSIKIGKEEITIGTYSEKE